MTNKLPLLTLWAAVALGGCIDNTGLPPPPAPAPAPAVAPTPAPAPVVIPAPVPAPAPYVPGTGSLQVAQAALSAMPQGNSATVTVALDAGQPVLQMTTPATTAFTPGNFVGGGTGNKVIVGFDGFDGLKLSDMASVEVDMKPIVGGASNFYMNFLVDLDCVKDEDASVLTLADIRVRRRVLVWIPGAGVLQPDGYTRYSVASTDSAWLIVGTPALGMGVNPTGPATPLTNWTGGAASCLVDGISGDGGLPRNLTVPACVTNAGLPATASAQCSLPNKAALLILGDSVTLVSKQVQVKRLKIKDREITFQ